MYFGPQWPGLLWNAKFSFDLELSQKGLKNIDISDIKFHQCVRLAKFDNERIISFIPADGIFDLITYRLETDIKSLFNINIIHKNEKNKIEFFIKVPFSFS